MSKRATSAAVSQPEVPLDTKVRPSRAPGVSTFEVLLETAAEILMEVGFEGLTTNDICKRAGMTPPALYRYFPNKFAVLSELGRRLMAAQDEVVFNWLDAGGLTAGPVETRVESTRRLQTEVNAVTRRHTGAMWILRALHAVPMLQQVRIESREGVAARVMPVLRKMYPHVPLQQLMMADRLASELMYSAMEMAMESPEQEEPMITEEACWMVCLYYDRLSKRYPPPASRSGAAARRGKAKISPRARAKAR